MSDDSLAGPRWLHHVGAAVVAGSLACTILLVTGVRLLPALDPWGPVVVLGVVPVATGGVLLHRDPAPRLYLVPYRVLVAACGGGTAAVAVGGYALFVGGRSSFLYLGDPLGQALVGCVVGAGGYLAWRWLRR